ncbi:hypothetical protein KSS87_020542 [Heliosperma pusillum]|nr:hypothetical protein KSS87_020648 [Heliosperma pusillum]KAH9611797.1 hypothetical protein KSS87_020542 [Heliosperma pusillum]
MSIQRSLFLKREVVRLIREVNNLKERNANLQSQLSAATNEKRVAQGQLAHTQSANNCSLTTSLKAAEDQEEERLFAETFPSKPDLSVLGDMKISDGKKEAGCSKGPDVASALGTVPAETVVSAEGSVPAEWVMPAEWAVLIEGSVPVEWVVPAEGSVPAGEFMPTGEDMPAWGDVDEPPIVLESAAD